MPHLTDTELRVLLIVVRQTLGWKSERGNYRKTSDWITHRQWLAKAGRESAAVSRAIQTLVQKRLIQVEDEAGQILVTAAQRRAVRGRLYYRLHPQWLAATSESEVLTSQSKADAAKSDNTKAKTTKETEYKSLCCEEGGETPFLNEADQKESALTSQTLQFLHRYSILFRAHSYHQSPPPLT